MKKEDKAGKCMKTLTTFKFSQNGTRDKCYSYNYTVCCFWKFNDQIVIQCGVLYIFNIELYCRLVLLHLPFTRDRGKVGSFGWGKKEL